MNRGTVKQNLKWGMANGLIMGVFYCVVAAVIFVVRAPKSFSEVTKLGAVIAVYLVAGVLGGAIVGLLKPLGRYAVGAMIVGIPVAFIVFSGLMLVTDGMPVGWSREIWIALAMLTALVGPLFGFIIWSRNTSRG